MPRDVRKHSRSLPLLEHKESEEFRGLFEQKRLPRPFSVKATGEPGAIEGHGAIFNVLHPTSSWALGPEWQDRILPGAFVQTLAESKKLGVVPAMLYMHERGNVPGVWHVVEEDKEGLLTSGQVSLSAVSPSGATLYELLKMGAINGLSIGFRVMKSALDEKAKVRDIIAVDLGEVSIVDIPGGPSARITDVKSGDPHNIQFLETVLRDAGLSRKEAKALLADGFTALRDAVANDEPTQRDADRCGGRPDNTASLASLFRGFASSIRHT
jgi:hypothetical protein